MGPHVSTMSTNGPVSVVVIGAPEKSKMPALLVTLLGAGRPVSAKGMGQLGCISPQACTVEHWPVLVSG